MAPIPRAGQIPSSRQMRPILGQWVDGVRGVVPTVAAAKQGQAPRRERSARSDQPAGAGRRGIAPSTSIRRRFARPMPGDLGPPSQYGGVGPGRAIGTSLRSKPFSVWSVAPWRARERPATAQSAGRWRQCPGSRRPGRVGLKLRRQAEHIGHPVKHVASPARCRPGWWPRACPAPPTRTRAGHPRSPAPTHWRGSRRRSLGDCQWVMPGRISSLTSSGSPQTVRRRWGGAGGSSAHLARLHLGQHREDSIRS